MKRFGFRWYKILALLLLIMGTTLLFMWDGRYVETGPELLRDVQFENTDGAWQYSDSGVSMPGSTPGVAELLSHDPALLVYITQRVMHQQRYTLLRLSACVKTRGVRRGEHTWQTARLVLVNHDPKGESISYQPHHLVSIYGDNAWSCHKKVFRVNEGVVESKVSVQLLRATGVFQVKDLSLQPVAERAEFIQYRRLAMLLWAVVAAWILIPAVKGMGGSRRGYMISIVALGIIIGSFMSGSVKQQVDRSLATDVRPVEVPYHDAGRQADNGGMTHVLVHKVRLYKWGHFLAFCLLTILVFQALPYGGKKVHLLAYLLLFAISTEVFQFFIEGRGVRVTDILIDISGIFAGAAILRIYASVVRYAARE